MLFAANAKALRHVGDTAAWVAALRAAESARPDAAFTDALAARLAGDGGLRIAAAMPDRAETAWGVVMRTVAIDRLLLEAVARGVTRVLSLGAGLDARPYRLALPGVVRWIEVDRPDVLEYKAARLDGWQPNCSVERIAADLADPAFGPRLTSLVGDDPATTCVLTEGVVPYLDNGAVARLAHALAAAPGLAAWILDYENAGERPLPARWARALAAAPPRFRVANWFEFFNAQGWRARQVLTSGEMADALARPFPRTVPHGLLLRLLPAEWRRGVLAASGAVRLERADSDAGTR